MNLNFKKSCRDQVKKKQAKYKTAFSGEEESGFSVEQKEARE